RVCRVRPPSAAARYPHRLRPLRAALRRSGRLRSNDAPPHRRRWRDQSPAARLERKSVRVLVPRGAPAANKTPAATASTAIRRKAKQGRNLLQEARLLDFLQAKERSVGCLRRRLPLQFRYCARPRAPLVPECDWSRKKRQAARALAIGEGRRFAQVAPWKLP